MATPYFATAQRKSDYNRLMEIVAAKRKAPTEDDKAFIRGLMDPKANRLDPETIKAIRPLTVVLGI